MIEAARSALTVALVEMLRVTRDRRAALFGVAMPLVLILVVGSAIGDADGRIVLGVVLESPRADAQALGRELDDQELLDLRHYDDRTELDLAIRRAEIAGGVVVPAGYDRRLPAGDQVDIEYIVGQNPAAAAQARPAVSLAVNRHGAEVMTAHFATDQAGGTFATNRDLIDLRDINGVDIQYLDDAEVVSFGFGYTAPASLVLVVLMNSLMGAATLVDARRAGSLRRTLVAPIPTGAVMVGQVLSRGGVAALQSLIVLTIGAALFDVEWGDPIAVAALVIVLSLVASGTAVLLGCFARTPEQALALAAPIGVALGMLGGCMWPLFILAPPLRVIGHVTPHAWAMDAFTELIFRDGRVQDIVVPLAVLGLIGLAVTAGSARALARRLQPVMTTQ